MKIEFNDTVCYRTKYNMFEHGRDCDNYSTTRAIFDFDDDPYIYADTIEEMNKALIKEALKHVRLPYELNRWGDGDNSIEFYETEIIREDMDENEWFSKIEIDDPLHSEEYKKAQAILCATAIHKDTSTSRATEWIEKDTDGYFTAAYKKLEQERLKKNAIAKKAREEKRRVEYETLKAEFEGE